MITGWWFWTCCIFPPKLECHHPNWLIFFRGVGQASIDWFKGKITWNFHISWEDLWFPVKIFPQVNPLKPPTRSLFAATFIQLPRNIWAAFHDSQSQYLYLCHPMPISTIWDNILCNNNSDNSNKNNKSNNSADKMIRMVIRYVVYIMIDHDT